MADRVVIFLNVNGARQGVAPSDAILVGGMKRGATQMLLNGSNGIDLIASGTISETADNINLNGTTGISLDGGAVTVVPKLTTTADATHAAALIGSVAGDPSSLVNGDIWYNTTLGKFRKREGGVTSGFNSSEAATFVVHPTAGVGDFTSIQTALNNLPAAGGLILVREGTYAISSPIALPNKPVAIYGVGRKSTILDISSNVISLFYDNFDQPRSYRDFTAYGNAGVGQAFMQFGPGPQSNYTVTIDNVDVGDILTANKELETTFLVDVAGIPTVNVQNCLLLLPALATSLWWKGGTGFLAVTDSTMASWDSGATRFRRGGCTGAPGVVARGAGIAFENNAVAGLASHFNDCYFYGYSGTSIFEVGNFSSVDGGIVNDGTFQLGSLCTIVDLLSTLDASGSIVRNIDIPVGKNSCRIASCFFTGSTSEAVRIASNTNIVNNNNGCKVTETGAADSNVYSANQGFSASTIIGPNSVVEGVKRFDSVGATTSGSFTTLFTHTNLKGVVGVGTIKNTGGVNSLEIKETVIDAFGITDSVTTTVLFGDSYLLDPQTNFATARPPHVSYKVEVRHPVAATTYTIHHATEGAL